MRRIRVKSLTFVSLLALVSPPLHIQLALAASLRATHGTDYVARDDDVAGHDGSGNDSKINTYTAIHSHLPLHQMSSSKISSNTLLPAYTSLTNTRYANQQRTDSIEVPLVGIGVGNLPHHRIPYILASALDADSTDNSRSGDTGTRDALNYRLIDTSYSTDSALEVLVGRSLSRLSYHGGINDNKKVYHVMIKIWHTHLGYERTMLSIQNSLSNLFPGGVGLSAKSAPSLSTTMNNSEPSRRRSIVRIHAILQYPRCNEELFTSSVYLNAPSVPTKYRSCRDEEDSLDNAVKSVANGQSPLLDKENSWKRSYRALEELYHHGTIDGIGISNFGATDLSELFNIASVGPHIYQGSLRTLMMQDDLVEELVKHGVHYQCYDAVSSILMSRDDAPLAYSMLERIGARHVPDNDETKYGAYGYSPIQAVLGYLVNHRGVGVIPGTVDDSHLAENSPLSLEGMSRFNPRQVFDIELAIKALLNKDDNIVESENVILSPLLNDRNEDLMTNNSKVFADGEGLVATFFNTLPHPQSVRIFQIHPTTGEQIPLMHGIPSGRSGRSIVNVDDVLIAYNAHGVAVAKFSVEESYEEDANHGRVDFTIKPFA